MAIWYAALLKPKLTPLIFAFVTVATALMLVQFHLNKIKIFFDIDSYGLISKTILKTITHEKLSVVAFGGSTMLAAVAQKNKMDDALLRRLGKGVEFYNLAYSAQSLLDTIAIIDNLNLRPGSLLILGINPRKFAISPSLTRQQYSNPRLFLINQDSAQHILNAEGAHLLGLPNIFRYRQWIKPALQQFYQQSNLRSCIHNLRHGNITVSCKYLFSKRLATLGPIPPLAVIPYDGYSGNVLPTYRKLESATRYQYYTLPAFNKYYHNHLYYMELLLKKAKRKQLNVILLILPNDDKRWVGNTKTATALLENDMMRLGGKWNFPVFNYETYALFKSADYYDTQHFVESGRNKFYPLFVNLIASLWDKQAHTFRVSAKQSKRYE